MLISERHQKILEILQKEKSISTKKLMDLLYVSEATIRRDLTKMELKGLLKRTHGGATIIDSSFRESSYLIREQTLVKEKRKIALKCLEFLNDNTTYFVDSSSTIGHLLYYFTDFKNITVITNGLNNAIILSQTSSANVYLVPGILCDKTISLLGSETLDYIKKFNCDIFLFSCGGISPNGISEPNYEQGIIKKGMLKQAKMNILLVDHTKFNKNYLYNFNNFEDIDYIITDETPDDIYIDLCKKTNTKLIIT